MRVAEGPQRQQTSARNVRACTCPERALPVFCRRRRQPVCFSPKGTPKTLAQHEVLGTWHSHSWLCVFPPGWKPLECSPLPPQRTYAGTMSPGGTTQSEFSPRQSQRDAEDFSPARSAGYVAQPFLAVRFSARVEAP